MIALSRRVSGESHSARKKRSGRLFYSLLAATLFVFSFYIYGISAHPYFAYLKDILSISVGLAAILHMFRHPNLEFNHVDRLVGVLFAYLLAQLLRTYVHVGNFEAAYLGFRLDFLPIVLYFGCRGVASERHRQSLHRLFLWIMLIGVAVTYLEFIATTSGLVSPDFFANLLHVPEFRKGLSFGSIVRIIGIAGTPHITGIHHLVLLAVLLYWPEQINKNEVPGVFLWPRAVGWLQVMTVGSLMLSTSRTAWVLLPFVLGLTILSQHRIRLAQMAVGGIALLGVFFLVIRQDQEEREFVVQTFNGFRDNYVDYVLDSTEQVILEHPVFGYGYEVAPDTIPESVDLPLENNPLQSDVYFAELFRMFGAVGLFLFAVLFLLIPLRILFSKYCSYRGKGAAMGVLSVGLATGHYSPFTSPVMSFTAWYLIALMAYEWSEALEIRRSSRTRPIRPSFEQDLDVGGSLMALP